MHIRVFLSYSHADELHRQRVLELANQLRRDGVDAWLDRYELYPDAGWPRWMHQQVEAADFVIIVTGGNMGIGRAAACLFAREGACVTIAARRDDEGRAVADQIVRDGGKAIFVRTDVSVASDHCNLINATITTFGRLDLAFNNAGTEQFGRSIVELDEAEWDRVISINLKGVFLGLKHQIPAMRATGGGAIVTPPPWAGSSRTPASPPTSPRSTA